MPREGSEERVVLLGQDGPGTRAIFHALAKSYPGLTVIVEDPIPKWELIHRRVKRLGAMTVLGQVLFMALVTPLLRIAARARIAEITRDFALETGPIEGKVIRIPSVNSDEGRRALVLAQPSVVVISGTRIIEPNTLSVVDATFINVHSGITPLYRGVHGGYWALADGRTDLVGTTVHLVDKGIDTGLVLEQVRFGVTGADSFATYPYLHVAAALPSLVSAVGRAIEGDLEPRGEVAVLPSRLRSHPTIWGYLVTRSRRGVK